jgi:hypothetical protein
MILSFLFRMNSARARSRTKQKIEELTAKVKEQGKLISNLEQVNDQLIQQFRVIEAEKSELMMFLQLVLHRGRGGIGDASTPSDVASAAATGLQMSDLHQPVLGCGGPPVGMMALLGKMDEAKLRVGGLAPTETPPSDGAPTSLGTNIFRSFERGACPSVTTAAAAGVSLPPGSMLARLLAGPQSRHDPTPPAPQRAVGDLAMLISSLGQTTSNERRAQESLTQRHTTLEMQIRGLAQQQHTDSLLQRLLQQQQQQSNTCSGSETDFSFMAKPHPEG